MADIKISIATPAFGEVFYTPYVQALLKLQRMADQRKWSIRHMAISYAYVGEARNALLTHWYDKSDSTHLLFIDADMGFQPQLIADMLALDKPITASSTPSVRSTCRNSPRSPPRARSRSAPSPRRTNSSSGRCAGGRRAASRASWRSPVAAPASC